MRLRRRSTAADWLGGNLHHMDATTLTSCAGSVAAVLSLGLQALQKNI